MPRKSQPIPVESPVAGHVQRGLHEGALIILGALAIYLSTALLSYDPLDQGWTHTGVGGVVRNAGGTAGAWLADVLFFLFGFMAYVFPLILLHRAWIVFRERSQPFHFSPPMLALRGSGFVLVMLGGCALSSLHFLIPEQSLPAGAGGILGDALGEAGRGAFSLLGATLLFLALFLVGVTIFTNLSWLRLMDHTGKMTLGGIAWIQHRVIRFIDARRERKAAAKAIAERRAALDFDKKVLEKKVAPQIEAKVEKVEDSKRVWKEKQGDLLQALPGGTVPPLRLLDAADTGASTGYSRESLEGLSRMVEIKLREYGIEVQVVAVQPGPVVTRFELQPAAGIKASQITNLSRDLARSMAVISVRVVEVIPGKSTVGIEIPNENRDIVRLSEVLSSSAYDNSSSPLTLALGKDISGAPIVTDLARMPHLLVAGTTGSGKSVAVNAMLLSLLFKSTPEQVRLIMIDPKMVELSVYNGIPHLLAPVVTDMKDAANALRWCVAEMERRYLLMNHLKVRNLAGYNRKLSEAEKSGEPVLDPFWQAELAPEGEERPCLTTLPQLVVVVDEFADLLISLGDKGKKVEELIARIAQKARAAGIHMILATQRPDSKVITGLIKANIPSRIAFQVSEKVQSRIILDQGGAEQLLGQGDMLYLPPGKAVTERVHGAFVSDDEVHRVVEDWKQRGEPEYLDEIIEGPAESETGSGEYEGEGGDSEQDPLYDEACAFVLKSRRPSISAVQRQLRIGYNRSARILEAMEKAGLVSGMGHNGQRDVLVPAREDA